MDEVTRWALAARDGDRAAAAAFIRTTSADVWRLCAYLGDPATADDLAQETYVRALRALPAYRGAAAGRTWLLSIARRVVADDLRARRRRRRLDEIVRRRSMGEAQSRAGADAGADAEVVDLLSRLSPERRLAFVLTQFVGLSYAEAAGVCGCPVGTIRSRVARARADLVLALAAKGTGSGDVGNRRRAPIDY